MKPNRTVATVTVLMLLTGAQSAIAENGWTGEASLSAGMTTGNTQTSEAGIGLDANRNAGAWNFGVQLSGDYGEEDGVENRNRYFVGTDINHDFSDAVFAFGRVSYEVDEFTGFDSRSFMGGGVGWHVLDRDEHSWTLRGGPGVKIEEVKRLVTTDETGAALIVPSYTDRTLGAIAQSKYHVAFNDAVSLTNKTDVIYSPESTQLTNTIGLTAAINGHLSARVSYDVRHDTNPSDEFEATDTATKFALVYKLGG